MKKLLVEVDENLWASFRGQAAAEGCFVRVLLERALRAYLNEAEPPCASVPFQLAKQTAVSLRLGRIATRLKTGRQLAEELEARRGDESGSQVDE